MTMRWSIDCGCAGWPRAFSDPDVAGVTGLVLPYELDFLPQLMFEAYGGMSKGFERRDFVARRDVGVAS